MLAFHFERFLILRVFHLDQSIVFIMVLLAELLTIQIIKKHVADLAKLLRKIYVIWN